MAIDCFVKIDGVESEATAKGHEKEIDALSWSWHVHQPSAVGSGVGGMAKGKAVPGEFVFTHHYDKASPIIAKYAFNGKHFPKIVATCAQAGEGQKDFLVITMKECMILHCAPSGSSGGDVVETVTLGYSEIEFDYKAMDSKGTLGGSVKFSHNVNTEVTS